MDTDTAPYEYTMSNPATETGYSEGRFLAPSDAAAVAFASTWPTANGWPLGTEWTVGRVWQELTVDATGAPINMTPSSATFAEGVTT